MQKRAIDIRIHPKYTAAGFFLAAFLFSACENDMAEVNALKRDQELPTETGRDVEIIYSDSGEVKMVLTAPLLYRFGGDTSLLELPEGVKVIFYDTLMQVESTLTADYAVNRESEKKMEARRNVVVVNNKGERLNTEKLVWDTETETIYTDEFVEIITENERIEGRGMEADQTFSHYRIKNVIGTFNIEDHDKGAQDP